MEPTRALLNRIDAYLAKTGMAETTFGRQVVNDGKFVARLRRGGTLTMRTQARIESFIAKHSRRAARVRDVRGRPASLADVIRRLRAREAALKEAGVAHIAVFGSVARGEARADSDVDLLVERRPDEQIGLFGFARLSRMIVSIVPNADVVDHRSLDPALIGPVSRDAVYAF